MKNTFKKYIETLNLFTQNDRLLIAVSGGIDSVCLCHLLKANSYNFAIAHCNFQLRDLESEKDEKFVKQLADLLQVDFYLNKFNTKEIKKEVKQSTQIIARNLRYNWFTELMSIHNFDYLLTAHHANDSFETSLINFSRGTGIEGVIGIKNQAKIKRPLLQFTKNQIIDYVDSNNISYRNDKSNDTDDYLRNKIRHHLIPQFENINKDIIQTFISNSTNISKDFCLFNEFINTLEKKVIIKQKQHIEIQLVEIFKLKNYSTALYHILKKYTFNHFQVQQLIDCYNSKDLSKGKIFYSKTHKCLIHNTNIHLQINDAIENTEIIVSESLNEICNEHFRMTFNIIRDSSMCDFSNKNCVFIDFEKLKFPLLLRSWKQGDSFIPFGMKGTKKVSDYLIQKKYSLFEKEKKMVLLSNNTICWLVGETTSELFKIENKTRNILKILFIPK